jgi:hypothetical protein
MLLPPPVNIDPMRSVAQTQSVEHESVIAAFVVLQLLFF